MFERFTERARQVVVLGQDEARDLRHDYIGTEHMLLGLICENEGIAARVLRSLGITHEAVREQLPVGPGEFRTSGQIQFLPPAKQALEASLAHADAMNHRWIGTEHLLLGLVADPESVGSRLLDDLGAPPVHVRERVVAELSGE